jgi:hypothetical protein
MVPLVMSRAVSYALRKLASIRVRVRASMSLRSRARHLGVIDDECPPSDIVPPAENYQGAGRRAFTDDGVGAVKEAAERSPATAPR